MIAAILYSVWSVCILAAVLLWAYSLADWDGEYHCDENDCEFCPFPCEKRKK